MITFPDILEENENNNLPISGRDPKFVKKMRPKSTLSMRGHQVEKFTLKTVQKHNNARIMFVSLVSCTSQRDTSKDETVNSKNSVSTASISEKSLTSHGRHPH